MHKEQMWEKAKKSLDKNFWEPTNMLDLLKSSDENWYKLFKLLENLYGWDDELNMHRTPTKEEIMSGFENVMGWKKGGNNG